MQPTLLPALLITFLSLGSIAIILRGLALALRCTDAARTQQRALVFQTAFIIALWMIVIGALAYGGFFIQFSGFPPRVVLAVLLPLPVLLWAAFSKKGTRLLRQIPPHWLIGMQAFRILVELLLWRAFTLALLPVQMTFEGRNYDVLSGVLAIVVAIMLRKKWLPGLVLVYNLAGLGLLINILVVAVLSMPTSLRVFMNEPSSKLVGSFPFIYLPAVLVVIAYALHIFSLRQWWLLRKSS